jgi:hypothetical protein
VIAEEGRWVRRAGAVLDGAEAMPSGGVGGGVEWRTASRSVPAGAGGVVDRSGPGAVAWRGERFVTVRGVRACVLS